MLETSANEIEALVERANALWMRAQRERTSRVELYAKLADRVRMERGPSMHRAREAGIALRTFTRDESRAAFASCPGLSNGAVDGAFSAGQRWVTAATPEPALVSGRRSDLDADLSLPSEVELLTWLRSSPSIAWVEAGTTTEVLIGPEGWVTARRRHRIWAMIRPDGDRLVAARGAPKWDEALQRCTAEYDPGGPTGASSSCSIACQTEAAAPIVNALVHRFHLSNAIGDLRVGPGWNVMDEPAHPAGLVGGVFDDAGFPTSPLKLSNGGALRTLEGTEGHLWRRSYREPPIPTPSNLIVGSRGLEEPEPCGFFARRCRVHHLTRAVWVLEFEPVGGGAPLFVRTSPERLIRACALGVGPARFTANGPCVPVMVFRGLQDENSPSA